MACKDKLITLKSYVFTFLKWGVFGLFMGVWGGLLGAGFHHLLHFVTQLRTTHTWLLFLLLRKQERPTSTARSAAAMPTGLPPRIMAM